MKILLKKIKDTKSGKIVEEKETAVIEYNGTDTYVTCTDRKLREQLEEILSLPFSIRKPVVRDNLRAFVMELVKPNTQEHITEISYLLRKAGFHVIIK